MDQSKLFSLVEMGFVYAVALGWAGWELWKVRKRKDEPPPSSSSGEAGHPEREQKPDP